MRLEFFENSNGLLKDSLTRQSRDFPGEIGCRGAWHEVPTRAGNRAFTMTGSRLLRFPGTLSSR
jgi:hypothetical protein